MLLVGAPIRAIPEQVAGEASRAAVVPDQARDILSSPDENGAGLLLSLKADDEPGLPLAEKLRGSHAHFVNSRHEISLTERAYN